MIPSAHFFCVLHLLLWRFLFFFSTVVWCPLVGNEGLLFFCRRQHDSFCPLFSCSILTFLKVFSTLVHCVVWMNVRGDFLKATARFSLYPLFSCSTFTFLEVFTSFFLGYCL